jgi:hypothetical protein
MRYVGAAVRGGMLLLAVIERDDGEDVLGRFVDGGFVRHSLPFGDDAAASLFQLKQSVQQDLRDWSASRVELVETTKYAQWKYADAFARVLGISAVMYAATEINIPFGLAKPNHVARHVVAPNPSAFESSRLGFGSPPRYWTTGGGEAYSAAAYAARL